MERNSIEGAMYLFSRLGVEIGTVIDAGAAEAGFFLMLQKIGAFPKARYLFIDCLEENLPVYRSLERAFGHRHEICALDADNGEVSITVTPDMYGTGIKARDAFAHEEKRTVPARRLDDVLAGLDLAQPYFLKLDLQGGEVAALRGASKALQSCAGVLAEARPRMPEDNRNNLRDLLTIMQDAGFVAWDIVEPLYKESSMTMYQCDVLFLHHTRVPAAKPSAGVSNPKVVEARLQHREKKIAEINALISRAKLGL